MKKCIVIPDSFKGSLDSIQICEIAQSAIHTFFPECEVLALPVADGGEGTVECFLRAMGGERVPVNVHGPFGEALCASYARIGDAAVIEMAAAAGLPLAGNRLNPAMATTYGVGELLRHAVEHGAKHIVLGLGGSATNDCGCGCAAAVGVVFRDSGNVSFVPTGSTLARVHSIDCSAAQTLLAGCTITAMCDIDNPLYGPRGAAYVFAPQKGADAAMVAVLDAQLEQFDRILQAALQTPSVAKLAGAGAAGGMGAGVVALLGAQLKPGIETVLDLVEFDRKLAGAELVFTGEGRIDGQSLHGKVISGVAKRAKRQQVPVIALVGDVDDSAYGAYELGVSALFSINRLAVPFSVAKTRSAQDYRHTLEDILRLLRCVWQR